MDLGLNKNILALGTDIEDESGIHFYDPRTTSKGALGIFSDSHVDGITQVRFDKENPYRLVSASMDGLMTEFDVRENGEDDAFVSSMNVNQPIRKIGYFGAKNDAVWALTCDESLALFHVDSAEQMNPEYPA